jgi:hypothetical protein
MPSSLRIAFGIVVVPLSVTTVSIMDESYHEDSYDALQNRRIDSGEPGPACGGGERRLTAGTYPVTVSLENRNPELRLRFGPALAFSAVWTSPGA